MMNLQQCCCVGTLPDLAHYGVLMWRSNYSDDCAWSCVWCSVGSDMRVWMHPERTENEAFDEVQEA